MPVVALAGDCEFGGGPFYAGEDTDFVLCGDALPADVTFIVDDPEAMSVVYKQPLQRCAVTDTRSGFHVVLNAENAGISQLWIDDAVTGEPLCSVELAVQSQRDIAAPEWLDAMPLSAARYIDVNGIRTRYFDSGKGAPIVLVHGGHAIKGTCWSARNISCGDRHVVIYRWKQVILIVEHRHVSQCIAERIRVASTVKGTGAISICIGKARIAAIPITVCKRQREVLLTVAERFRQCRTRRTG